MYCREPGLWHLLKSRLCLFKAFCWRERNKSIRSGAGNAIFLPENHLRYIYKMLFHLVHLIDKDMQAACVSADLSRANDQKCFNWEASGRRPLNALRRRCGHSFLNWNSPECLSAPQFSRCTRLNSCVVYIIWPYNHSLTDFIISLFCEQLRFSGKQCCHDSPLPFVYNGFRN